MLSPIITLLLKCAKSDRILRKYLKNQILPPLRDVMKRPEEGDTLRNYLCRYLTSYSVQMRDLVAELLFVLCKENSKYIFYFTLLFPKIVIMCNVVFVSKMPSNKKFVK